MKLKTLCILTPVLLLLMACGPACELPVRTETDLSVTFHHLDFSSCGQAEFKDRVGGEHRMVYTWQAGAGETYSLNFKAKSGKADLHLEVNGRSIGVGSGGTALTTNFTAPERGAEVIITVVAHPEDAYELNITRK